MQKAVVLGVCVPDQCLKDGRVEQLEHPDGGSGANAPDEFEALREARSSVGRVFAFGGNSERLTEVFLMKPARDAVRSAVVPFDQQAGLLWGDGKDFDARRRKADAGGKDLGGADSGEP